MGLNVVMETCVYLQAEGWYERTSENEDKQNRFISEELPNYSKKISPSNPEGCSERSEAQSIKWEK